jgi:hypothetical protein
LPLVPVHISEHSLSPYSVNVRSQVLLKPVQILPLPSSTNLWSFL